MLYHRKKQEREEKRTKFRINRIPCSLKKSKLRKIREQKTFLPKKTNIKLPDPHQLYSVKIIANPFFTHFSAYAACLLPSSSVNFVPVAFFHANIAAKRHRGQPFSHFSPFLLRSWTLYLSPCVIIQNVGPFSYFSYSFCLIKSKKERLMCLEFSAKSLILSSMVNRDRARTIVSRETMVLLRIISALRPLFRRFSLFRYRPLQLLFYGA